jgi:hypothetical protein
MRPLSPLAASTRIQEEHMLPRFLRNGIIKIAKQDVLEFLDEHEEQLVQYFLEEIQAVDQRMDEEKLFIDIRMRALGEELLRAVLKALRRFIVDFGESDDEDEDDLNDDLYDDEDFDDD